MKHAGSTESLRPQAAAAGAAGPSATPPWHDPRSQSLLSKLTVLAAGLFLLAVLADGPVRALAQSLDPSARAALRIVTEFGNSAWPLGSGLVLLLLCAALRRSATPPPPADLAAFRSAIILLLSAVALSGALASLTKHVIGRIRPSTEPDAMVMDFAFMAIKAGWAAFPSGHATTATAAAVALGLCFPRHAWAWLAVGVTAALSRALLGVHWLSDCLAGILLGAVVALLLHRRMVAAGSRHQEACRALPALIAATASALRRLPVAPMRAAASLLRRLAARARPR